MSSKAISSFSVINGKNNFQSVPLTGNSTICLSVMCVDDLGKKMDKQNYLWVAVFWN